MTFKTATAGSELPALELPPIDRRSLALFAGGSGDHQPVHLDIDAAKVRGRDDVIAHGMLSMAYLGRLLTNWVPQERIRSFNARFVAVTPVLAQPTCTGIVRSIDGGIATVDIVARLSDGTVTVTGEATVDIS